MRENWRRGKTIRSISEDDSSDHGDVSGREKQSRTKPNRATLERIEAVLASGTLPGAAAHKRLAPYGRPTGHPEEKTNGPSGEKKGSASMDRDILQAAVLILLYQDRSPSGQASFLSNGRPVSSRLQDSELYIPFILRPDDDFHHAGQIALPGGRHEGEESFPVETALRESREELGIHSNRVRIIGKLSSVYVHVSRTLVSPVVACSEKPPQFSPDPREVAQYFSVPFSRFLQEPLSAEFESKGKLVPAPYFLTEAGKVWGATAMILSELAEIYRSASLPPT